MDKILPREGEFTRAPELDRTALRVAASVPLRAAGARGPQPDLREPDVRRQIARGGAASLPHAGSAAQAGAARAAVCEPSRGVV